MTTWALCTRKVDETPIYINLDLAMWLRWNDGEEVTVVMWSSKNGEAVRVLETSEEIFEKVGHAPQHVKADNAAASAQRRTKGRRNQSNS